MVRQFVDSCFRRRSAPRAAASRVSGRRFLNVLAGAAIVLAGSGACSSAGPHEESSQSFTYWSMWRQDEPQAKVLTAAIDSFQKDSGITVTVKWQGRQVITKTAEAIKANRDVPDLVDQGTDVLEAGLVTPGWASDLTKTYQLRVDGEPDTVQDVIPDKFMPMLSDANGVPFVVPYEIAGEAVFFDKARHPEIAADKPHTWDQFVALLKALKAKTGRGPIALDSVEPGNDTYWLDWPLERVLGPGQVLRAATDATGESWDDPLVLDVAEKVESLVKGGYFAPGYNTEADPTHDTDQENLWAKGGASLILGGTWTPSETSASGLNPADIDSFQFPQLEAKGDTSASVVFFGFAMPKQAAHADAAGKFVAYFLNKSRLAHISTDAANMTPRIDIPAPVSLAAEQTALITRTVFTDEDGLGREEAPWFNAVFKPACARLVKGQETAKQWVAEVKTGTQQFWASHATS
jgi:ABC-type glycerol-3-phosphate transport system substrate-binding protein